MHLALVHYAYPPVIGGVERIMEEHARLFRAQGHEVTILCQRGGGGEQPGVRCVPLPLEDSVETQIAALRAGLAGAEVIFVHNVMTMPFHAGLSQALEQLAAEMPTKRFVAWIHDVAAANPDLSPAPAWASRPHRGFSYVAVSELRRRQWRDVSGVESTVIPNGVDPVRVLGLPASLALLVEERELLDGRILLLHPTRLLRRKNVECSLAVTAELNRSGQLATLLVTGAPDLHNAISADYAVWLHAERQRLNADALFLGLYFPIGDAELSALYRLADALIFPSRQEGFGLPVLEAGLHRLPVFCSDIAAFSDFPEEMGERFGLEEPPGEIAAHIARALDADHRRQWRREVLTRFAWPAIYRRYLAPMLEGAGAPP